MRYSASQIDFKFDRISMTLRRGGAVMIRDGKGQAALVRAAEFSDIAHDRGILSAARSANPNSANSQFFICFQPAPHLDRQYTVFGKVIKGMEFIDKIKKGEGPNGSVKSPDKIISLKLK